MIRWTSEHMHPRESVLVMLDQCKRGDQQQLIAADILSLPVVNVYTVSTPSANKKLNKRINYFCFHRVCIDQRNKKPKDIKSKKYLIPEDLTQISTQSVNFHHS